MCYNESCPNLRYYSFTEALQLAFTGIESDSYPAASSRYIYCYKTRGMKYRVSPLDILIMTIYLLRSVSEEDRESLEKVVSRHYLTAKLSDEENELLWKYRVIVRDKYPNCLPLLVSSQIFTSLQVYDTFCSVRCIFYWSSTAVMPWPLSHSELTHSFEKPHACVWVSASPTPTAACMLGCLRHQSTTV